VNPVSENTLYQRINRHLKHEFIALRKSRSEEAKQELGHYYLVDTFRNLHRNIFFRDCAKVPVMPYSALDSWHPKTCGSGWTRSRRPATSCWRFRITPT
jgi:hypothetical protein